MNRQMLEWPVHKRTTAHRNHATEHMFSLHSSKKLSLWISKELVMQVPEGEGLCRWDTRSLHVTVVNEKNRLLYPPRVLVLSPSTSKVSVGPA